MPSTEAGKRLVAETPWWPDKDKDIAAIEAEAREKALAEVYAYTVHCLERVRRKIEELPWTDTEIRWGDDVMLSDIQRIIEES